MIRQCSEDCCVYAPRKHVTAPVGDATADLAPEPTPSTTEPQEGK